MAGASHIGKAGELAVRSEFLLHGYNVAVPEVDVGDDLFVIEDRAGDVWRVQVKTTLGQRTRYGCRGRFEIPLKQLAREDPLRLLYVFAVWKAVGVWEFLVVPREFLWREHAAHGVGSEQGEHVRLHFAFRERDVTCSNRSFQPYRARFDLSSYP